MTEDQLTQAVCAYLRLKGVLFHFDFGSGTRLTMGQAVRQRRMNQRAFPDISILEPRFVNDGPINGWWAGFFLELKKEGTRIRKKDGELVSDPHIREQAAVLEELRKRGYRAEFCVGFDSCKKLIDEYLS